MAALLQQILEVDPLASPTCRGPMRIVARITQASVIDQILAHLRTRARRRSDGPLSPAPTPRQRGGRVRLARRSHRGVTSVRPGPRPPARTSDRTARYNQAFKVSAVYDDRGRRHSPLAFPARTLPAL